VLEIGPGDSLGVALCFVAKGARSVVCLDRFEPFRDESQNAAIYRRLLEQFSEAERERVRDVIRLDGTRVTFAPDRIEARYGMSIEEAAGESRRKFDLIVSRAVLEHVADLEAAWSAMTRLLQPTGEMWHKVDFRGHHMFTQLHPLYFLTFGDRLWDLISSPDPTLNRERLPTYRRLAARSFESSRCYITHVLEGDELRPHQQVLQFGRDYAENDLSALEVIRPSLQSRFRLMSDEELLAAGIFLICRRLRNDAQ
jgi:SAM-dependent methyltransferase